MVAGERHPTKPISVPGLGDLSVRDKNGYRVQHVLASLCHGDALANEQVVEPT